MRDKVGTFDEAGVPNHADGDGHPDRIDVARHLAILASKLPDCYET